MMNRSIVGLVFLAMLATNLFSVEIVGFRNLKWNDPSSKLGANKVLESTPQDIQAKLTIYHLKNEKLVIGKAKLTKISYTFFDNKFDNVMIEYQGFSNFIFIKGVLEDKYGNGKKISRPSTKEYTWEDKNSIIELEYDEILETGSLFINNSKLDDAIRTYRSKIESKDL